MARIRSLKPGFFTNEELCDLGPWHRLFFAGLWIHADREGRLEDRPKRLKVLVFPYDSEAAMGVSADQILADLAAHGFVQRYQVAGQRYLMMPNFGRHQLISRDELPSQIPAPDGEMTPCERPPNETVRSRIYQRDGFACAYCGRVMAKTPRLRCVDHVIPYSRGGSHQDGNLVTACKACNAKKGARTPEEAEMPWPQQVDRRLTPRQPPVDGSGQVLGIGNWELGMGKEREPVADVATPPADGAGLSEQRASDFAESWNRLTMLPIPRCKDLTSKRKRQIRVRLSEAPVSEWEEAIRRIQGSSFCRGENDRGWRASFDWLIGSPDVRVKVMEGKYDDRGAQVRAPAPAWVCPHDPPCDPTYKRSCMDRQWWAAQHKEQAS